MTDLFETPQHPLVGQKVRPPTNCQCGSSVAVIRPGTESHAFELRCSGCDAHREWLSKSTVSWIATVAGLFGAPEIITLRSHATVPQTSPASGTTSNDGAVIHEKVRAQQSRELAAAGAKSRRRRKPEDWDALHATAMAKRGEQQ